MLNFKNTNIIFICLFSISIVCHLLFGLPFIVTKLLIFFYLTLLFYGSYRIGSGFYFPVICSARMDRKLIAISFDDGPAANYTPEILQQLKDNRVEAAFFCIGRRISGNEILINRIHTEGHIIGNHSFSHHMWFDLLSATKMSADLQRMNQEVFKVCGLRPRFFRPPYGVTNPPLKKAMLKGHFIPIGWDIRSMDTVLKDEKKMLQKILRALHPGAVILFHDTSRTTLSMLPEFIRQARKDGYEFLRLDKMLKLEPYA